MTFTLLRWQGRCHSPVCQAKKITLLHRQHAAIISSASFWLFFLSRSTAKTGRQPRTNPEKHKSGGDFSGAKAEHRPWETKACQPPFPTARTADFCGGNQTWEPLPLGLESRRPEKLGTVCRLGGRGRRKSIASARGPLTLVFALVAVPVVP